MHFDLHPCRVSINRRLCPPAAATSNARLAASVPAHLRHVLEGLGRELDRSHRCGSQPAFKPRTPTTRADLVTGVEGCLSLQGAGG
jgi:hypothetical protein